MATRNTKKQAPKASKPTKKRQESVSSSTTFDFGSPNSFSDNNYSGVDDIEDEDDLDEDDVYEAEGRHILNDPSPLSSPGAEYAASDADANDGDNESNNDNPSPSNASSLSWAGFPDHDAVPDHTPFFDDARKVRFAVPSDTSESSEDENIFMYPDIFVDQDVLDPNFRYHLEHPDENSSDSESFWDFEAQEPRVHAATAEVEVTRPADLPEVEDEYSDGETTEDEDYPDGPIKLPTTESPGSDDSDTELEPPVRHSKDQPLTTGYDLSKHRGKPMAVFNNKTKKVMIFMPAAEEPTPSDAFDGQYADFLAPTSPNEDWGNFVPMLPHQDPFDFSMGFDPNWGAEPIPDSSSTDAASEAALDLSTFIVDGESDDESQREAQEPASTPVRPTTATSEADVLGHLHSNNVGAFRQNQVNARLIRNGATQDSIDFSNPYENTVIKGIRSDRFDTAIAPLTPARRHKRHNSDAARSPLDAASAKRKASDEDAPAAASNHKKQKSISTELTDLHM